jgi:protein transport protein HofC
MPRAGAGPRGAEASVVSEAPDSIRAKYAPPAVPGRSPRPSRWRLGMGQLIYLVFDAALVCWVLTLTRSPLVALILLVLIALNIGLAVFVARRRSNRQDGLVRLLAVAAERGVPLGPAVEACTDQYVGAYLRRVRRLANALEEGATLPEALDRAPGVLSSEAELLARVGWETGNLPGALREDMATRGVMQPVWRGLAARAVYLATVLYVLQAITGLMLWWLVPTFQAILNDFNVVPTPAMRRVFGIAFWFNRDGWEGTFLVVLLVELVLLLTVGLSFTVRSRNDVPVVGRLFIPRHRAVVLRSLAWMIEGALPLPRGLAMLAERYPTPWVRRRLQKAALDVEHGTDWLQSLLYHRLLKPGDAALLESARRVGNLPWTLRLTASSGERRFARRFQAVLDLLLPVVILALGSVVVLMAVGYFAPIVKILEVLAE